MVEHTFDGKLFIQPQGSKISTTAQYMDWIMKDAVEIQHRLNNLNREDGLVSSRSWIPLVHSLLDGENLRTRIHNNSIIALSRTTISSISLLHTFIIWLFCLSFFFLFNLSLAVSPAFLHFLLPPTSLSTFIVSYQSVHMPLPTSQHFSSY